MKRIVPILALLGLVGLVAAAQADGCRRVTFQRGHHVVQQQVVHQNYAHNYAATTFLQVPVPVYPVYGVGYGAGEELRLLRDEILQLRKEMLYAEQQRQQPAPQVQPPQPQQPKPEMMPPPRATPLPQGLKASPYQEPKFVAYIRAECASCHGTAPKGNKLAMMLDNNDTLIDTGALARKEMFLRVALPGDHPKRMPKGGEPPPDEILSMFAENALK